MNVKRFLLGNIVVITAWTLALVSVFFVPPDAGYKDYFDLKTLVSLFVIMLVIAAYKNLGLFEFLGAFLIRKFKNTRALTLYLVMLTYVLAIFISNDTALLTFLPLTLIVYRQCGKERYIPITIIMQNIGANLGGMIVPFGDPQSLYLYNYFNISMGEFVSIMYPSFLLALAMILIICFCVKKEEVTVGAQAVSAPDKRYTVIYGVLFVVALLIVFRVVNYLVAGAVTLAAVLIMDRKALRKVDFGLLLTFAAFFVFANNMARIDVIRQFVSMLTEKNTLITAILCSQIISNVPTALFLSKFTDNYAQLLLGVNIGGTGTLVASLASLISFKIFIAAYPKSTKKYLIMYGLINLGFLAVLTVTALLTVRLGA